MALAYSAAPYPLWRERGASWQITEYYDGVGAASDLIEKKRQRQRYKKKR